MALLRASLEGTPDIWNQWLPYATAAVAIVIAVTNVTFLTKGMQENEALFMVTIFEGSMIVANALSGVVKTDRAPMNHALCLLRANSSRLIGNRGPFQVVLRELDDEPVWKNACYTICIVVVVAGLAILISGEGGETTPPAAAETASVARATTDAAIAPVGGGADPELVKLESIEMPLYDGLLSNAATERSVLMISPGAHRGQIVQVSLNSCLYLAVLVSERALSPLLIWSLTSG